MYYVITVSLLILLTVTILIYFRASGDITKGIIKSQHERVTSAEEKQEASQVKVDKLARRCNQTSNALTDRIERMILERED